MLSYRSPRRALPRASRSRSVATFNSGMRPIYHEDGVSGDACRRRELTRTGRACWEIRRGDLLGAGQAVEARDRGDIEPSSRTLTAPAVQRVTYGERIAGRGGATGINAGTIWRAIRR
jgi:hypothetical protein